MARAVLRAEDFYLPPPAQAADAWDLVPPAERAVRWYEEHEQRRLPRPQGIDLSTRLYARIDAGRWVADCPCYSAQIVSPNDPRLLCVECLSGWFEVVFPADVPAAEEGVASLPAHERFWWNDADDRAWNRPQPAREPTAKELARAAAVEGVQL